MRQLVFAALAFGLSVPAFAQTYACPQVAVPYPEGKLTGTRRSVRVESGGGNAIRGVGQFYERPGPMRVHGVHVVAYADNGHDNCDNDDSDCETYNPGISADIRLYSSTAGKPGTQLASKSVALGCRCESLGTSITGLRHDVIFDAPVDVVGDFWVTFEHDTGTFTAMVTNDHCADDGDNEHRMAFLVPGTPSSTRVWQQADTFNSTGSCSGSNFDSDAYLEPIVSYDYGATFTYTPQACLDGADTLTFTATGINPIVTSKVYNELVFDFDTNRPFAWNFDDIVVSDETGQSVMHTYGLAGNYDPVHTVTSGWGPDDDCSVMSTQRVGTAPTAGFTPLSQTVDVATGGLATFASTATNAAAVSWDFGDGSEGVKGTNPSHAYLQRGDYVVTQTASNGAGCDDVETGSVHVIDTNTIDLVTTLTENDASGTAIAGQAESLTLTVSNTGDGPATGTTVSLDFPEAVVSAATWTCVGTGGGTCPGSGSGDLVAVSVNLPSGGAVAFTLNVTPASTAGGFALSLTGAATGPGTKTELTPANNSATLSRPIQSLADISVTVDNGLPGVTPGQTGVAWTVVVHNAGPSASPAIDVDQTGGVPTGLQNASWTCNAGACGSGAGAIDTTISLTPGQSATLVFTADVAPSALGTITVAVTAASPTITDPATANNADSDVDDVYAEADVGVTLTDAVTSVVAGGNLAWTSTVTNAGPGPADATSYVVNFPADVTDIAWTCTAGGGGSCGEGTGSPTGMMQMAIGESRTFAITAKLAASSTLTQLVVNASVTPTGSADDPNGANDTASDTNTVTRSADIALSVDNAQTGVLAGQTLAWEFVVANLGPSNADAVSLAATVPASLTEVSWQCNGPSGPCGTSAPAGTFALAAGAERTWTLTARVPTTATGTVTLSGALAHPGTVPDPIVANDTDSDADIVGYEADLSLTWLALPEQVAGDEVTLELTVRNDGPSDNAGYSMAVTTTPRLEGMTWTCDPSCGSGTGFGTNGILTLTGAMPSGDVWVWHLTGTIPSSATGTVMQSATLTITGSVPDPDSTDHVGNVPFAVRAENDVFVTVDNGATVIYAGDTLTWDVVVGNDGPSDAADVHVVTNAIGSVTDLEWTCTTGGADCGSGTGAIDDHVAVVAGGTATYALSGTLSQAATGSAGISATVTSQDDDAHGNDTDSDSDPIARAGDLVATVSNGVDAIEAGTVVTYTLSFLNDGPTDNQGASFTASWPPSLLGASWTCLDTKTSTPCGAGGLAISDTSAGFEAGHGRVYTLIGTTDAGATGTMDVTASITASGAVTDPDHGNDTSTDSDPIGVTADLAVTLTDGQATVVAGDDVTYTLTVRNNGPGNNDGATLTLTPPTGLEDVVWTCADQDQGPCGSGAGALSEAFTLTPQQHRTYTLDARVSPAQVDPLVVTARVTSTGLSLDPAHANDTATDTDAVTRSADLSVAVTNGADEVVAGGDVTYVVTVGNLGPSDGDEARVVVVLDPALEGMTWTCDQGGTSCGTGDGGISEPIAVPADVDRVYTLTGSVGTTATGTVNVAAAVTADGLVVDFVAENNVAEDDDVVVQRADHAVTVDDGATTVRQGATHAWQVVVTDEGPSNGGGVTLTTTVTGDLTDVTWSCLDHDSIPCGSGSGAPTDTAILFAGDARTYTIEGTVSATATGTVGVSATLSDAVVNDPDATNDTASDSTAVLQDVDLSVALAHEGAEAVAGTELTGTVTVTNDGAGSTIGATLTVTVSEPLEDVAWTCVDEADAPCGEGTGVPDTTLDLGPGAIRTFTVTAFVSSLVGDEIVVDATVTPGGDAFDVDTSNDTASLTIPVAHPIESTIDFRWGSCACDGAAAPAAPWWLGALGLLVVRRRRR